MGVNKTLKKNVNSGTDKQKGRHRDLETESAQWADSVKSKICVVFPQGPVFLLCYDSLDRIIPQFSTSSTPKPTCLANFTIIL